MLNNKKAFELSINMIVVIILGLTLMGVGISIFYQAYNKTVDIKENVDAQTQRQLNDLLDTGEAIVIPINNKEGERGDYVDFDIGISNELGSTKTFFLYVRYDGFVGRNGDDLALQPKEIQLKSCRSDSSSDNEKICADEWVLLHSDYTDSGYENTRFVLANNARKSIPIRIVLPRKVVVSSDTTGLPSGQYIFNVDVFSSDEGTTSCDTEDGTSCKRYFSKKKLYIKVN
ncbi:MAG: hypothetical protein KC535_03575 [Nanoarchaeota archaeon]|nr:hypothetical protein [Nanoarchaeota archaeon]